MFWGCHEHVLDDKGRTSLPKDFRDLLTRGSQLPWLTARSRCLAIYPAEKFDAIRARLSADVLNDSAEAAAAAAASGSSGSGSDGVA